MAGLASLDVRTIDSLEPETVGLFRPHPPRLERRAEYANAFVTIRCLTASRQLGLLLWTDCRWLSRSLIRGIGTCFDGSLGGLVLFDQLAHVVRNADEDGREGRPDWVTRAQLAG